MIWSGLQRFLLINATPMQNIRNRIWKLEELELVTEWKKKQAVRDELRFLRDLVLKLTRQYGPIPEHQIEYDTFISK